MKKMISKTKLFTVATLITAGLATGCSPIGLALSTGAGLGVAAAQEGGIEAAATDAAIRLQVFDLWFKNDVDMYRRLNMAVKEGRVLVTGTVPDPDTRVEAIRLVWQADGVRQVINEIRIEDDKSFTNYVQDTWITGQLRTKLTFDRDVQSINYNIETVKGTVYLMGIAQDDAERQRVIDHARNLAYVDNVVSYIRLRGEVPTGLQEPTGLEKR